MPRQYDDLINSGALGYMDFPYTKGGMTYHDIPVHTEKNRQTLSDFQRNKILDEQIDYLLKNPMQMDYEKIHEVGNPGWNYGQKIWDPEKKDYRSNPQGHQNIWRMHGETDDYWDEDWDKLYGEERYAPAKHRGDSDPLKNPNWVYIKALENFKDFGGDIDIMNTEDAYKDKIVEVWNPRGGMMDLNLGPELTGTGGFFNSRTGNMTLNPANVVKKYPTAPMGPDSEWEFLGPNEVNVNTPYFEEGDAWHMNRIVPHEAGHLQEDIDAPPYGWKNYYNLQRELGINDLRPYSNWEEPNPGAYLEGIRYGDSYSDFPRHPRMHMMDRSQWNKTDRDKTLSKTQYQNFLADQARSMNESINRSYWHDEDWDRAQQGFGGSGRSRTDDRGRPMQQSQRTIPNAREQGIRNQYQQPSPQPDKKPFSHHFSTGGLVSLVL